MNARTSRSAKAGQNSTDSRDATGKGSDLVFDDLLDARFDDQGRLSQVGRGSRQRIAERLDPRPPATSAAELEQAVRKLAEGLEAIEKQSRTPRAAEAGLELEVGPRQRADSAGGGRDFVTYSLDRLETRLEALSKRLQNRSAEADVAPAPAAPAEAPLAEEHDFSADSAKLMRMAEAEAERIRQEAEERRLEEEAAAAEAARLEAEAAAERRAAREAEEERAKAEAEAEAQRFLEEEAAKARRRAEEEAAEARRLAEEEAEAARLKAEAEAEARRIAEEEAAEAQRLAEEEAEAARLKAEAEAEARRIAEEAAEARRRAEEEAEAARLQAAAEAEAKRIAEEQAAEARRRAKEAEAEARRLAEAAERERLSRLADARREAEMAAELQRQFAEIDTRIDALERVTEENQVEPVREELIALLQEMEGLGRDRDGALAALQQIGTRLGEMEAKVNAARNMAGNRLGDIQDRLAGLGERLGDIEVEIPGFDAVRENQSAILERFDRMEGLVQRVASPEEMFDKIEGLRRNLGGLASHKEAAAIEARILTLAERLDALPEDVANAEVLGRIESQLATLASELSAARQEREAATANLDQRIEGFSALLQQMDESGSGVPELDGRIAELTQSVERLSGEALARMERQLEALTTAVREQEDDATADLLAGLMGKVDVLAEAIEGQQTSGSRQDIELLDGKLDQLAQQIAEQTEHISGAQVQPLALRLDQMQRQLDALAERAEESSEQLGPFVQTLQDISERFSAMGSFDESGPLGLRLEAIEEHLAGLSLAKGGPDPRALQTQLDAIVSRLELLKGRSIDPARLNELFDRVDTAIRALPEEDEEGGFADGSTRVIEEKLERLEQRIIENASGAREAEERFARLESKLDQIGLAYSADGELLSPEDLGELREDITLLRRELRSMPAPTGADQNIGELLGVIAARMEHLPEVAPATSSQLAAQMQRIADLLDDPSHSRLALAHIETSLKTIEERLEETRRAFAGRPVREGGESDGDIEAVAGMARSLSDDVSALKGSAGPQHKASEALEAVQGTLEAVVKRMAFLERDAERAADNEAPTARAEAGEPEAIVERLESARVAAEDEGGPKPEASADEASAAPERAGGESRFGGGLLSRLTSRQLLRRATGGRADSFTPEPEESAEESDFPIEPGTDSPLSSALTGAPSSDTHALSGGHKSRLIPALGRSGGDELAALSPEPGPEVDEDFLAAARRAARAAAAEATDGAASGAASRSALGRVAGAVKSRRTALMAAALALAVAFAAMQIIRSRMNEGASDVAAVPTVSAPAMSAGDTASAPPPATATMQAEAPAATSEPPGSEDMAMAPAEPMSGNADKAAAMPSEDMASAPPAESPDAPAGQDMAAVSPTQSTPMQGAAAPSDAASPVPTSSVPTSSVPASASASQLPIGIGSQRLRDAAQANDPVADFEVATRYAEGRGVAVNMTTAVSWYERAAATGLAPAQYRLGSIYEKGLGVPKDLGKAQDWYRKAAAAGNVKAMHNLAVLNAEGAGGEPNLEQAAALFRQAAEHGVRDSQFNLAILHARGLGVKQDLIEAYKWFAVAATSGDEEAAKRRDIIAAALKEPDLAKAQAAASAFEPLPLDPAANEVAAPDGGWGDKQDSTSVEVKSEKDGGATGSVISENDLVAMVQKLLSDKGFDPGPADGLLGTQTMQAIRQFQSKSGLPRTGLIDPDLVQALRAG